jgi:hexosaminidase
MICRIQRGGGGTALSLLLLPLVLRRLMAAAAPPLLWPLPRSMSAAGVKVVIDPETFEFTATGRPSTTLTSAFERYTNLLAATGAAGAAAAAVGDRPTLAGLHVDVASNSLALGIDTSEAYNLTVAFPFGTLAADTVYGALRGLETFSQLLSANRTIAAQTVVDFPRFPHRGVMLDTARHFLPVPFIVGFVEAMSYSKLNVLHMHLTDSQSFPVESTAYPKLTDAAFKLSNGCRSLANPMPNESHVWHGKIPNGWHRQPQAKPLTNCTCEWDHVSHRYAWLCVG